MNHFIRLEMPDEGYLVVRPEHITGVMELPNEEFDIVMLTRGNYEIKKGQISLDCLVNHTSHAGVRVLG